MVENPLVLLLIPPLVWYLIRLHRASSGAINGFDFAPLFLLDEKAVHAMTLKRHIARWILLIIRLGVSLSLIALLAGVRPLLIFRSQPKSGLSAVCVIADDIATRDGLERTLRAASINLSASQPDDSVLLLDRRGVRRGPLPLSAFESEQLPDAVDPYDDRPRPALDSLLKTAATYFSSREFGRKTLIFGCDEPLARAIEKSRFGDQLAIRPFIELRKDELIAFGDWRLNNTAINAGQPVTLTLPFRFSPDDRTAKETPAAALRATLTIARADTDDVQVVNGSVSESGDALDFILSFPYEGYYLGQCDILLNGAGQSTVGVPLAVFVRAPETVIALFPDPAPPDASLVVRAVSEAVDARIDHVRVRSAIRFQPDEIETASFIAFYGIEPPASLSDWYERNLANGAIGVCLALAADNTTNEPPSRSPQPHHETRYPLHASLQTVEPGSSDSVSPAFIEDAFRSGRNGGLFRIEWPVPQTAFEPSHGETILQYRTRGSPSALWTSAVGRGRDWRTPLAFGSGARLQSGDADPDVALLVLLRELVAYSRRDAPALSVATAGGSIRTPQTLHPPVHATHFATFESFRSQTMSASAEFALDGQRRLAITEPGYIRFSGSRSDSIWFAVRDRLGDGSSAVLSSEDTLRDLSNFAVQLRTQPAPTATVHTREELGYSFPNPIVALVIALFSVIGFVVNHLFRDWI